MNKHDWVRIRKHTNPQAMRFVGMGGTIAATWPGHSRVRVEYEEQIMGRMYPVTREAYVTCKNEWLS